MKLLKKEFCKTTVKKIKNKIILTNTFKYDKYMA